MQQIKSHIDGKWWTSDYIILEHPCEIKMKENKGCKIHIWNKDKSKVIKTFRFSFANEQHLLNKAELYIKSYENNI